MSQDTTTIAITTEQKRALDKRKAFESQSYKAVLQHLLDNNPPTESLTEERVRELAREEIRQHPQCGPD